MTKTGKVLTAIGGLIVLLLAATVIFVMTFDWNRLKPTINDKVSAELQRPFAIRGNLGWIGHVKGMSRVGAVGFHGHISMLKIWYWVIRQI